MTSTTFRIGGDLTVSRLGFGAMRLPTEGPARVNSLAVARLAVELGITLIDTAHLYGGGANEELLAEALHPYPDGLLVTTKVGVARTGPGGEWKLDGRPEVLRDQVDQALRRLRVERLELLQLHRVDPETPLADQLGTLRDLRDSGKIGRIGLSEVSVAELDQARQLVDIASVQNRYSLLDREHEPVLAACEAVAILQRVASAVRQFGGNVLSSQVELEGTQSKGGLVSVTMSCELDQPQLQQLLYDLEAGMPFLFVEQLVVQAPQGVAGGVTGTEGGRLRVLLAVSGQWQEAR